MDSNFFALISRMRYIERWSLMRNSIHENIQEHSHMVAVIAHALGVIRRDVYGINCPSLQQPAIVPFSIDYTGNGHQPFFFIHPIKHQIILYQNFSVFMFQ